MSLRNTNDEAVVTLDGLVSSTRIYLDSEGIVILSTIVQDRGEGWMPITPLSVKLDNAVTELPVKLAAGHYVIDLVGAPFVGSRLALEGYGMLGVTALSVDVLGTPMSGSMGSIDGDASAEMVDLLGRVTSLEGSAVAASDLLAVSSRVASLEQSTRHEESDLALNVTAADGVTVTFRKPFASSSAYRPDAYGLTADGSKVNCSWSDETASGITFWPDVDVVKLYWGATEIK